MVPHLRVPIASDTTNCHDQHSLSGRLLYRYSHQPVPVHNSPECSFSSDSPLLRAVRCHGPRHNTFAKSSHEHFVRESKLNSLTELPAAPIIGFHRRINDRNPHVGLPSKLIVNTHSISRSHRRPNHHRATFSLENSHTLQPGATKILDHVKSSGWVTTHLVCHQSHDLSRDIPRTRVQARTTVLTNTLPYL